MSKTNRIPIAIRARIRDESGDDGDNDDVEDADDDGDTDRCHASSVREYKLERFEAARSAAEESSTYIYIYILTYKSFCL